MNDVKTIKHPLVQHKLTHLRDRRTEHSQFRLLTKELTAFMLYEVMADYPLKEKEIETPLQTMKGKVLAREISLILILRAGLGMLEGALEVLSTARVGHIGLYRDEETLAPVRYYVKLPKNIADTDVILFDPMLATGGSAVEAVKIVKEKGVGEQNIKFVCMVAAPEGVKFLNEHHPEVAIYCAALDEKLNKVGYILPGLGDAGDRLFGTK